MTELEVDAACPYPSAGRFVWLEPMLEFTDPHCSVAERDCVLQALHRETSGSAEGLTVFDAWCRRSCNYPGLETVEGWWNSVTVKTKSSANFASLCILVEQYGFDWIEICCTTEPGFERAVSSVVDSDDETRNQLRRYSLAGHLDELERDALEQVPILGGLALLGQATTIYAAPNTGKTLLTLWLLIESIRAGVLRSSRVFYINADDNLGGLIEKLRISEEYEFHMVAEGFRDFSASHLMRILSEITASGQAHGVVVVIDVAKKFVDVMSKRDSAAFGKVVRRFVLQGGTSIILGHTNKKVGHDGRPVFAGVSDSLEDTDNAFVMQTISEPGAREKVVAVECSKRRGSVRQRAVFGYSTEEGISYDELLASVRMIADGELESAQRAEEVRTDAEVIALAKTCISEGIVTKMQLAAAIAQRCGCSKRGAVKVLDRYTGIDPKCHEWTFTIRARGAKTYRLLVESGTNNSS